MQAVADLAAGNKFAFGAGQGAGVYHKVHGEGGLVYAEHGHAHRVVFLANGDADADVVDTGNNHDFAGFGFILRHALKAFKAQQLVDAALCHLFFVIHHRHHLAGLDAAIQNTANAQAAGVTVVIELRNLQLQRRIGAA